MPTAVPPERAILAANMETALNIVWDAEVSAGDRVTVVGAGVVGALAGYLCARMPGTEVCLVDVDEQKAALAEGLGCAFAAPGQAAGECDVAIHASASSDGLATAIGLAGMEATIVEASWFGTHRPEVPLGGAFHQRRLRIVGSSGTGAARAAGAVELSSATGEGAGFAGRSRAGRADFGRDTVRRACGGVWRDPRGCGDPVSPGSVRAGAGVRRADQARRPRKGLVTAKRIAATQTMDGPAGVSST